MRLKYALKMPLKCWKNSLLFKIKIYLKSIKVNINTIYLINKWFSVN